MPLDPCVSDQAGKLPLDPCRLGKCIAEFVQAWPVQFDREAQARPVQVGGACPTDVFDRAAVSLLAAYKRDPHNLHGPGPVDQHQAKPVQFAQAWPVHTSASQACVCEPGRPN